MDEVTKDAKRPGAPPAVANLSYNTAELPATHRAINESIQDADVVWVVSAGNRGEDSCPRATSALVAGASTQSDSRPHWSGWGRCVDLFAPGVDISVAMNSSDTAYGTDSGTSFAAAHVSAAAAFYRSYNPEVDALRVMDAITNSATRDVLINIGVGSPNLLLYLFTSGMTPPPPPLPPLPAPPPTTKPAPPTLPYHSTFWSRFASWKLSWTRLFG
ncbi:S8 family serine peptidase [Streptomyces sp. NPDC001404]|uniref:S8 family serine peptidase n=1 Tax=Streptomyces sp. NPDC001404 TaxID=3364571 RepID=UPI0036C67EDD